ncbi:MAG: hypothetical protein M0D55_19770 [Elusimicrobiota bacterium]|nr:MAG: hypothetical protein M0D55_19770 [Elusimicrobiota bacterium]
MLRPDVVEYLRENLKSFPVDILRKQLAEEGISDVDFNESLAQALRAPTTVSKTLSKPKGKASTAAIAFLCVGVAIIVSVGLFALGQKPAAPTTEGNTENPSGESGFIGHAGWIVRLPKDYVGISDFKDSGKQHQIVYFCKKGTDPTNFLNEGLFGQLGIVKLEVMPTQFPNNPTGVANLSRLAAGKYKNAGEKFSMKNMQVATLPGVSVTVLSPFPRAEAFVLGQDHMYFFMAGQEDDVWRDIVLSLRDAHTEN